MAQKTKKSQKNRLHVSYAEANRVRSLLLSSDVEMLSKRDVQTLIKILNDVYPVRQQKTPLMWQPLFIGIGIGLLLVIGIAVIF